MHVAAQEIFHSVCFWLIYTSSYHQLLISIVIYRKKVMCRAKLYFSTFLSNCIFMPHVVLEKRRAAGKLG